MKLNEIYAALDGVAPKRLSDEYCAKYGAYDNSGILVDCGEEIKGALFSLDLSSAAIENALVSGANLIVVHHPAIYGKIGSIRTDENLGKKLIKCIRNGVSVVAMHLNLDCAIDGIDETLREGIFRATGTKTNAKEAVMHPLEEGGYGRAYEINACTLKDLKIGIEKEFSTKRVLCYGEETKSVSRVASFCGAGVDEGTIAFSVAQGADVIVSSDFKHHLITTALESGIAVMILPHYASENYGFKKYYEKIRRQINLPCAYHTDEILL